MTEVVIVGAARTSTGSVNGSLSSLPAHALGEVAIREALKRAGVDPSEVSEVVLSQVLTGGAGQNPARQAAVNAGIPVEKTALFDQSALRARLAHGGAGLSGDQNG